MTAGFGRFWGQSGLSSAARGDNTLSDYQRAVETLG